MNSPNSIECLLVRSAAVAFSGRGAARSLLVLIFHRVLPERDPVLPGEPDAARFTAILDLLAAAFNIIPLVDAARRLREGTLPRCAACITFDDGYANNCDVAGPLLAAKGLPATVFVAPGFLDGGRMFNDTVIETVRGAPTDFDLRALGLGRHALKDAAARRHVIELLLEQLKYLEPAARLRRIDEIAAAAGITPRNDLMMTSAQVRQLRESGIEVGAHTMDHPILTSVDDATALAQITTSKRVLEGIVGAPVRSFAYPNGKPLRDYDRRHVEMVGKTGFEVALSTAWGAATATSDIYQIPRVAPWDPGLLRYGLRLAKAYRDRVFTTA